MLARAVAGIIHRADGSDVTDPQEFIENRSLFTEEIGIDPPGPAAAHKGFGLAAVVETLCAVLTGQKTGRENLGDDPTRRDDRYEHLRAAITNRLADRCY